MHRFLKTEVYFLSLFSIWPFDICATSDINFWSNNLNISSYPTKLQGQPISIFFHWAAVLLIIFLQSILMKDFKWHCRDVLYSIFYKIKLWAKLCTENDFHAFQNMDLTLYHRKTHLESKKKNQGYNSQFWLRFFLSNFSLTCYTLLIFPKWKGSYLFITYIYVSKNAFTIPPEQV